LRVVTAVAACVLAVAGCAAGAVGAAGAAGGAGSRAAGANPDVDTGTPLGGRPAPDFRLVNQFGQRMSLSQFRGKVVVLSFDDAVCTTVCPLTTTEMLEAEQLLGNAGNLVQLLGVDANPDATAVSDVMAYSRAHGMVNRWDFLTGTKAQLHAVWKAYAIYSQIKRGVVDHTPALYVIDRSGREQRLYLTQMKYASTWQQAQILAQEVSRLLPGQPRLARHRSLAYVGGQPPPPGHGHAAQRDPCRRPGHFACGPAAPGGVLRHLGVAGI
jgi:cytochrome oxidase Cu insertion factor (SCO1/SenC/PrrC family)